MGQKMFLDFDWSHQHINIGGNGRVFKQGVVHVQIWKENKDGTFTRVSNQARCMNNEEIKKYGALIKYFCPDVKFR